jgi:nucleotidyltransferase substrate binding protein (TIGR01987 family)
MIKKKDKKETFTKAFAALEEALDLPIVTNRDFAGVVQSFEFCYEACWKYLKADLEDQGLTLNPPTPRQVFSLAFQNFYFENEQIALDLIKDRNLSTHTYDRSLAEALVARIQGLTAVG